MAPFAVIANVDPSRCIARAWYNRQCRRRACCGSFCNWHSKRGRTKRLGLATVAWPRPSKSKRRCTATLTGRKLSGPCAALLKWLKRGTRRLALVGTRRLRTAIAGRVDTRGPSVPATPRARGEAGADFPVGGASEAALQSHVSARSDTAAPCEQEVLWWLEHASMCVHMAATDVGDA